MKASTRAIRFLESMSIPEGQKVGQPVKLAPFQREVAKNFPADSRGFRSR